MKRRLYEIMLEKSEKGSTFKLKRRHANLSVDVKYSTVEFVINLLVIKF